MWVFASGLAFSPDGRMVAACGVAEVVLWDVSGSEARTILRHRVPAFAVAISPDGKLLAAASESAIYVWGTDRGELVTQLGGHEGQVRAVAFSPDGLHLATGSSDRTVRLWDVRTGQQRLLLRGHAGRVNSVQFHPSGRYLLSGSEQPGEVKLWDLTVPSQEYQAFPAAAGALAFTSDGKRLVAIHPSGASIFDLSAGLLRKWRPLENRGDLVPGTLMAVSGDGRRYVAVNPRAYRQARVVDVETGRVLRTWRASGPVHQVAISHDGRRLATAAGKKEAGKPEWSRDIRIYDVETGEERAAFQAFWPSPQWVYHRLALSPRGDQVAFEGYELLRAADGTPTAVKSVEVRVFDVTTRQPLAVLKAGNGILMALSFSPDGRYLAASGTAPDGRADGATWVWQTGDWKPLHDRPFPGAYLDLAFSPDGRRLAAADRTHAKIWDVALGQEVLVLRGTPQEWDLPFNPRVAWSADGLRLATNHFAGSVCDRRNRRRRFCGWREGCAWPWRSRAGKRRRTFSRASGRCCSRAERPRTRRVSEGDSFPR
jgi:WD40 repeat protein